MRRLLNPALIFVVCQAGVGFLHYLYQLFANQYLPLVDFGSWSVWFAQFALILLVAIWAQSLATLDGPKQPLFRKLFEAKIAWPVLGASIVAGVLAQWFESWHALTALGWFWACWQGIIFGRSLAKGSLVLISAVMIAAAVFKLLIPAVAVLTKASPEVVASAFYSGILWGPLAGLVIAVVFDAKESATNIQGDGFRGRVLGTSLLLAAVTSVAPQFDLLVAGKILDAEDLGRFGRVALVYKAFFFLILIFAQLLLSKQVQAGGGQTQPHRFLPVIAAGALMSLLCFLFFPSQWAPTHWVALGVLHISTLTFLFLVVQTKVSQGRWRLAAVVVGLWCLQFLVFAGFQLSIEVFYFVTLGCDLILILYALRHYRTPQVHTR